MGTTPKSSGVSLPSGQTGSSFFRNVLADTIAHFPEDFKAYRLPNEKAFKKNYGEAVVQFEGYRVASERRSEIARFMVQLTHEQLVFQSEEFEGPMIEFMKHESEAVRLESKALSGQAGLVPEVPFRGVTYRAQSLTYLGQKLLGEHKVTTQVSHALTWLAKYAQDQGGKLDLRGHKFAILGASAELSPTKLLLEAGASVLWIDIQSPDVILNEAHKYAGTLFYSPDARNILEEPQRIKACIEAFAGQDAVHIGMFAYAAGASQEWRLCATMNAIVLSLAPSCVASVSMLISPTSAAVMQPEDARKAQSLSEQPPLWQKALKGLGQLRDELAFDANGIPVARAIVPIQGVSYQAAQYISKILAAEVFATQGISLQGLARPIRVSSNVAGITKTRSLQHPVFQAAFLGAPTFGVEIFEVPTTRALSTMLILHDILNPTAQKLGDISTLFAKQVHGGIYSRAFALDPMIRIATVMGLVKRPKLLLGFF